MPQNVTIGGAVYQVPKPGEVDFGAELFAWMLAVSNQIEIPASVVNILSPKYGADPTGVADSTPAIQNAVNDAIAAGLSSSAILFPPGTYKVTGVINVKGSGVQLLGSGNRLTVINFEPSAAAVCFYFGDSSDHGSMSSAPTQYFHCGIFGMQFKSLDVNHQKTAIFTHSQSNFTARDILIAQNNWRTTSGTNVPSVGINLQNIQAGLPLLDRCELHADRPIWISADTAVTFVANLSDHLHIKDSYLENLSDTTSTNPALIYVDDMFLQNLVIDGTNAWIPKKTGFYWVAPTETGATLSARFTNIRQEQTGTPRGEVIHINVSGAHVYGLQFENIQFDSQANGIFVTGTNVQDVRCMRIMRDGVPMGGGTARTVDISAQSCILDNIFTQGSTEVNMNSMLLCFGSANAPDNNAHLFEVWCSSTFAGSGMLYVPGSPLKYFDASGQFHDNFVARLDLVAGASLANQLDLQGSATGQPLVIATLGSDTDRSIVLEPAGAGSVQVYQAPLSVDKAITVAAASHNSMTLNGATTGNPAQIASAGGDTDIGLVLDSKGAGAVTVGASTARKVAFYGHAGALQQLLATGAGHTVDDVITALQALGLVKQS